MVGLARNMMDRGQYDEAEKQLLAAIKMGGNYPASYRILLQVYEKKGETHNAIDAAIEYVDTDSDPSWQILINVGKKNLNYAIANMRAKMKTSNKSSY